MYKKQLLIQKIVCFFALVVAVILFLYTLGIMTDLYDTLYSTLRISVVADETDPSVKIINATERSVAGAKVYTDMQEFNRYFLNLSIVYLLIVALMFVTNTSTRRRYYISNYVSIGLFAAMSIYIPIYAHPFIEYYKAKFLQVDFAALKEFAEGRGTRYTESTMWFDLHYVVFALLLLAMVLVVAMCVWKILLMREERKLVQEGEKVKT